ncbi:AraC-like DNA-binding protein [Wenyingzhuangia heitensis]|uniref:AraC-like DNA-binding protein n=1 Tax=Wenyingzhuangia heitensis TaxID=1487859 RepID=A0ABX0U831_9FLAO|nr:helix-turn-helix domain-containing protein [Wenyingzhuangia heitensis]NIJ44999.1 AraC-like DNA-binding protein [Wenyingzhuangia heitensis]
MKIFNTIEEFLAELGVTKKGISPDFYLLKIQDMDYAKRIESFPHYKRFFEIAFHEENKNSIKIGHTVLEKLNNSITFTSPMQPMSINRVEKPTGYVLFFTSQIFKPKRHQYDILLEYPFFKLNTNPIYNISKAEKVYIKNILETMYIEMTNNETYSLEIIESYVNILLFYIKRILKGESGNVLLKRYEEITSRFEEMILQDSQAYKKIADYASGLHITPIYLSECVKKATGLSAKKVLMNYQILRAKSLLIQTTHSIDEIAHIMGFDETTNFIKFFKNHQMRTPLAFRKLP